MINVTIKGRPPKLLEGKALICMAFTETVDPVTNMTKHVESDMAIQGEFSALGIQVLLNHLYSACPEDTMAGVTMFGAQFLPDEEQVAPAESPVPVPAEEAVPAPVALPETKKRGRPKKAAPVNKEEDNA